MTPTVHTAEVLPARAFLFLAILAFHALLAYLFANGFLRGAILILKPESTEVEFINERKPPPTPPPVVHPVVRPTTLIAVTPPDISIDYPLDPAIEPLLAISDTEVPPIVESQQPRVIELPIRLVGRNVMPNTEDYYPARDRRDGNEGTAEVRSCVNENGRLDGSPTVERTSGRLSLDNAAVRVARDGKYARAVRGDTSVPHCHRFRVTFTMH
jgi:TonB family protein